MDIRKLSVRTISGIIYIGIIIAAILSGTYAVALLAILFSVLAVIEFAKICSDLSVKRIPTLILDIVGCICLSLGTFYVPLFLWIIILIARFVEELYIVSDNPLKSLSHSMVSQLYIGLPLGCMVAIADNFCSPTVLLAVFIFIWINDTGAFVIGSLFGRNRLFERISPKKSWEGFFGGVVFNCITAALLCHFVSDYFALPTDYWQWLGLACIVSVFATWGDLVESLIKRHLHIKDSGNMIPGHGGILDRIDSLLLVAPAVYIYLTALEWFVV